MLMYLIEPCCTQRHWPILRDKLKDNSTVFFHGYGDLSLEELLSVILLPYAEADMMLVTPTLPDHAAEILLYWLRRELTRMDGSGKFNVVKTITLITNLSEKKSPLASTWLTKNPFPGRLTLRNVHQNDTALIFPDLALYGAFNLTYGGHFTAIATKNAGLIDSLRKVYSTLTR